MEEELVRTTVMMEEKKREVWVLMQKEGECIGKYVCPVEQC